MKTRNQGRNLYPSSSGRTMPVSSGGGICVAKIADYPHFHKVCTKPSARA